MKVCPLMPSPRQGEQNLHRISGPPDISALPFAGDSCRAVPSPLRCSQSATPAAAATGKEIDADCSWRNPRSANASCVDEGKAKRRRVASPRAKEDERDGPTGEETANEGRHAKTDQGKASAAQDRVNRRRHGSTSPARTRSASRALAAKKHESAEDPRCAKTHVDGRGLSPPSRVPRRSPHSEERRLSPPKSRGPHGARDAASSISGTVEGCALPAAVRRPPSSPSSPSLPPCDTIAQPPLLSCGGLTLSAAASPRLSCSTGPDEQARAAGPRRALRCEPRCRRPCPSSVSPPSPSSPDPSSRSTRLRQSTQKVCAGSRLHRRHAGSPETVTHPLPASSHADDAPRRPFGAVRPQVLSRRISALGTDSETPGELPSAGRCAHEETGNPTNRPASERAPGKPGASTRPSSAPASLGTGPGHSPAGLSCSSTPSSPCTQSSSDGCTVVVARLGTFPGEDGDASTSCAPTDAVAMHAAKPESAPSASAWISPRLRAAASLAASRSSPLSSLASVAPAESPRSAAKLPDSAQADGKIPPAGVGARTRSSRLQPAVASGSCIRPRDAKSDATWPSQRPSGTPATASAASAAHAPSSAADEAVKTNNGRWLRAACRRPSVASAASAPSAGSSPPPCRLPEKILRQALLRCAIFFSSLELLPCCCALPLHPLVHPVEVTNLSRLRSLIELSSASGCQSLPPGKTRSERKRTSAAPSKFSASPASRMPRSSAVPQPSRPPHDPAGLDRSWPSLPLGEATPHAPSQPDVHSPPSAPVSPSLLRSCAASDISAPSQSSPVSPSLLRGCSPPGATLLGADSLPLASSTGLPSSLCPSPPSPASVGVPPSSSSCSSLSRPGPSAASALGPSAAGAASRPSAAPTAEPEAEPDCMHAAEGTEQDARRSSARATHLRREQAGETVRNAGDSEGKRSSLSPASASRADAGPAVPAEKGTAEGDPGGKGTVETVPAVGGSRPQLRESEISEFPGTGKEEVQNQAKNGEAASESALTIRREGLRGRDGRQGTAADGAQRPGETPRRRGTGSDEGSGRQAAGTERLCAGQALLKTENGGARSVCGSKQGGERSKLSPLTLDEDAPERDSQEKRESNQEINGAGPGCSRPVHEKLEDPKAAAEAKRRVSETALSSGAQAPCEGERVRACPTKDETLEAREKGEVGEHTAGFLKEAKSEASKMGGVGWPVFHGGETQRPETNLAETARFSRDANAAERKKEEGLSPAAETQRTRNPEAGANGSTGTEQPMPGKTERNAECALRSVKSEKAGTSGDAQPTGRACPARNAAPLSEPAVAFPRTETVAELEKEDGKGRRQGEALGDCPAGLTRATAPRSRRQRVLTLRSKTPKEKPEVPDSKRSRTGKLEKETVLSAPSISNAIDLFDDGSGVGRQRTLHWLRRCLRNEMIAPGVEGFFIYLRRFSSSAASPTSPAAPSSSSFHFVAGARLEMIQDGDASLSWLFLPRGLSKESEEELLLPFFVYVICIYLLSMPYRVRQGADILSPLLRPLHAAQWRRTLKRGGEAEPLGAARSVERSGASATADAEGRETPGKRRTASPTEAEPAAKPGESEAANKRQREQTRQEETLGEHGGKGSREDEAAARNAFLASLPEGTCLPLAVYETIEEQDAALASREARMAPRLNREGSSVPPRDSAPVASRTDSPFLSSSPATLALSLPSASRAAHLGHDRALPSPVSASVSSSASRFCTAGSLPPSPTLPPGPAPLAPACAPHEQDVSAAARSVVPEVRPPNLYCRLMIDCGDLLLCPRPLLRLLLDKMPFARGAHPHREPDNSEPPEVVRAQQEVALYACNLLPARAVTRRIRDLRVAAAALCINIKKAKCVGRRPKRLPSSSASRARKSRGSRGGGTRRKGYLRAGESEDDEDANVVEETAQVLSASVRDGGVFHSDVVACQQCCCQMQQAWPLRFFIFHALELVLNILPQLLAPLPANHNAPHSAPRTASTPSSPSAAEPFASAFASYASASTWPSSAPSSAPSSSPSSASSACLHLPFYPSHRLQEELNRLLGSRRTGLQSPFPSSGGLRRGKDTGKPDGTQVETCGASTGRAHSYSAHHQLQQQLNERLWAGAKVETFASPFFD
ncbi:conserved hypothetical protein [Neospora caninum Liverpool]|uniref:Uncharacterized protein n=1 Tax=Neospora caninum (strain Liverpool) TaxID=572307 RepID=F0VIQ9_NEOCL|nr:conserved hypothetical protein [Neospora caninum Liverpool]CBZ53620.1 conserved hypothetical protein [Neospora caninum Liverpool]CEL67611.1 TPA: hypothetical protein BN1204_034070 [Neospora caninum Liverpool]|eukprot:XP_003883652.1 conserved hypothetical protein [Neospora caninum Liverpool]